MTIQLNRAQQPLSQPYQLANDSEMRLLLGYSAPPRAGKIKALSGGVYTVEIADGEDAAVQAIALNGNVYRVGSIVYLLQASNAPDSGVIIGSQAYAERFAVGAANPDGPLHAEDGTGAFAVLSACNIDAAEQTITGARIRKAVMGDVLAVAGTTNVSMALALSIPPASYNAQMLVLGSNMVQVRLYSNGELRVLRMAGSQTIDMVMHVLWI